VAIGWCKQGANNAKIGIEPLINNLILVAVTSVIIQSHQSVTDIRSHFSHGCCKR